MANCLKEGYSTFCAGVRVVKETGKLIGKSAFKGGKIVGSNANKGASFVLYNATKGLDKLADKISSLSKEKEAQEAKAVEEVK